MADEVTVYFNPACSKCRGAQELLGERGIPASYLRYLEERPSRSDLEHVMELLGIDDPRKMMRTDETLYQRLGLAAAGKDRLLEAIVEHPILLQRPIVIRGNRAVIARPPEKLLELLDEPGD